MAAEANELSPSIWWKPAVAVIFLREGRIPAKIDLRPLPDAVQETQTLNVAIQAGKIDVIEIAVDDKRRHLPTEEKATLQIRFVEDWFVDGGIGVVTQAFDTHTGQPRPRVKTLLLAADQVRALGPVIGTLMAADRPDEATISGEIASGATATTQGGEQATREAPAEPTADRLTATDALDAATLPATEADTELEEPDEETLTPGQRRINAALKNLEHDRGRAFYDLRADERRRLVEERIKIQNAKANVSSALLRQVEAMRPLKRRMLDKRREHLSKSKSRSDS